MIMCLKNSVAFVLGENSAEQKNSGKMSDNCLGVREQHNSSLHGDPERSQSSPCFHSEPKLLLALPSLAASHGAGWPALFTLALQKETNIQMKEPFHKKACSPPRLPPPLRPLLSRWFWTVVSSDPSSFITRLSAHFHFQAACYPLQSRYHFHSDIQSLSLLTRKSSVPKQGWRNKRANDLLHPRYWWDWLKMFDLQDRACFHVNIW